MVERDGRITYGAISTPRRWLTVAHTSISHMLPEPSAISASRVRSRASGKGSATVAPKP
jgi:hypothetical protein